MVRALHEAGIEVILDVVYNHTAEGNHLGPTLSFRGIDNAAYYRLVDDDRRYYMDTTGTGNSLLMRNPHVLQLIMDSLRYWVPEMHVDGFRFDLAAALARQFHEVDRLSSFFDLVQQDPVVSQVKLIAEPWDVGDGGYQVGNFPPLWTEWNGKYRDTVRDFWRGQSATLPEFASRLTGSSDLYQSDGRRPVASVNFVTAHDGFTLADLVSYDHKHNEANGEDNRDGTRRQPVLELRRRGPDATTPPSARCEPASSATSWPRCCCPRACRCCWPATSSAAPSAATTTATARTTRSPGWTGRRTPGRDPVRQHDESGTDSLLDFARTLIQLRASHPVFRRRRFFQGEPARGPARPGRRHRLVHPGRRGDDRRGLGRRVRQVTHRVPERRRHQRAGPARPARPRRLVPAAVQRQRDRPEVRRPGRPVRRAVGCACWTPRPSRSRTAAGDGAGGPPVRAGDTIEVGNRSLQVLRRA